MNTCKLCGESACICPVSEVDALRVRVTELEALFQRTHGVHWSWVDRVAELEGALLGTLRAMYDQSLEEGYPLVVERARAALARSTRGGEGYP